MVLSNQRLALAVNCMGGYHASIAATMLHRAGSEAVDILAGGIDAWKAPLPPMDQPAVASN